MHADELDHHGQELHAATSTLYLRVAALFIILVGGLVGVVPPICGSWLKANPDSAAARALRAFSGGTILALALVSRHSSRQQQLQPVASSDAAWHYPCCCSIPNGSMIMTSRWAMSVCASLLGCGIFTSVGKPCTEKA